MNRYYVNSEAQTTGEHEVHKTVCSHGASFRHRIDLGYHAYDESALRAARQYYSNVDGCAFCCPSIHHR